MSSEPLHPGKPSPGIDPRLARIDVLVHQAPREILDAPVSDEELIAQAEAEPEPASVDEESD